MSAEERERDEGKQEEGEERVLRNPLVKLTFEAQMRRLLKRTDACFPL